MEDIATKTCKYCKGEFKETEFPICSRIGDKVYRRLRCGKCKIKIQNERKQVIRQWLQNKKKELHCANCSEDDFRVLDFHHIGNDKEVNVADTITRGWSIKRIQNEMAKCQVLCCKCHRILTWEKKQTEVSGY